VGTVEKCIFITLLGIINVLSCGGLGLE